MIIPAGYQGDIAAGAAIDMKITSWDEALGTMDDIAAGAVAVYKDNSTTESTAGVTLTVTFDSKVGLANIRITTASDGTFYAAGSNYTAVLTTGTIGGTDHSGFILGSFSIANRPVQGLAAAVTTAIQSGLATAAALTTVDTVVDAIKVVTDALTAAAAAKLALSAGTMVTGTVDTGGITPTAVTFDADDITEATADHYNGRVLIWTSGALAGQATSVSDYSLVSGRGRFVVATMTEAPANNDTFILV